MINELIYSLICAINIVAGATMIGLLFTHKMTYWPKVAKTGFAIMAIGLIGQAVFTFLGISDKAPIWLQFWVLKDAGICIFASSITNNWLNDAIMYRMKSHISECESTGPDQSK